MLPTPGAPSDGQNCDAAAQELAERGVGWGRSRNARFPPRAPPCRIDKRRRGDLEAPAALAPSNWRINSRKGERSSIGVTIASPNSGRNRGAHAQPETREAQQKGR